MGTFPILIYYNDNHNYLNMSLSAKEGVWSLYSHNHRHLKASFNMITKLKGERMSHCLKHTRLKKVRKRLAHCASTDWVQQGPYKNNQGTIFLSMAWASDVSKWIMIWFLKNKCLIWIFAVFEKKNNTVLLMSVSVETVRLTKYQLCKN